MLSVTALFVGFCIQNLAELRGGGPELPPLIARLIGAPNTPALRIRATMLITVIVATWLAIAHATGWHWGAAALASALAANAIQQLLVSASRRAWMPGTGAGIAFMLPPALWTIASHPVRLSALIAGPLLSAAVLVATWALAARIARR